jgi:hypothetical protein
MQGALPWKGCLHFQKQKTPFNNKNVYVISGAHFIAIALEKQQG